MQGNELPGSAGFYKQPIFAVEKGFFACRYTRTHIRSADMNTDLPDLTLRQSRSARSARRDLRAAEFSHQYDV